MAHRWSAENAINAYLRTLKMEKRGKEPDVTEFISALAAGNNARVMVMVCAGNAGSTLLALVAAAHQTWGRVVCILHGLTELQESQKVFKQYADTVEFIVGDARRILLSECRNADFVLIDCKMHCHREIFRAAQKGANQKGALLVGYNALHFEQGFSGLKANFLPIGEGLLVSRASAIDIEASGEKKKSHWIAEIDKHTGEEHFYRISTSSQF